MSTATWTVSEQAYGQRAGGGGSTAMPARLFPHSSARPVLSSHYLSVSPRCTISSAVRVSSYHRLEISSVTTARPPLRAACPPPSAQGTASRSARVLFHHGIVEDGTCRSAVPECFCSVHLVLARHADSVRDDGAQFLELAPAASIACSTNVIHWLLFSPAHSRNPAKIPDFARPSVNHLRNSTEASTSCGAAFVTTRPAPCCTAKSSPPSNLGHG